MMYAIETKNLRVSYGDNEVIKGVNLQIPPNCVFALMGPSGCGKSTMLRTFNRLLDLNDDARVEGEVLLFGKNIYEPNVDPVEIRKQIGMVFQYPNPFPHLTIYDNVAIGLKLNRLVDSKEELDERVEWALKKAALWDEVKDRLDDYPSNLSGGQRQRLVIARALAMRPKVLLMDEPTANIDPVGTQKIEELLFELKEDYTIVLVTHSPAQAARVSDYVAFLYLGDLIEVGPTRKVFENPEHELTEKYVTGALG
ncbi:phosphate ABC transporter ATP-binding protein [Thermococcus thioreducens]|uniref:Phosphate ABC transporter ATP-binding protein n=1 Tax=Thermococcus thioreducens TaxID=277988 RepID=A0A0Q2M4J9_9EURY|nr:phosphate ABC transporter ATP-binding protein [Thermococcus thioreducens]ASJ12214.1 phosphate ABC transporter ATP-binding protein [Thermococcus thioreducens]KQH82953.1 phosphate ABC transporter ATP-binding protein [Thermococcus thioreducens]SEV94770.1 phosphate ABC transporter ATP-binding protein, PhoT family [Thermococcus thioreducens]